MVSIMIKTIISSNRKKLGIDKNSMTILAFNGDLRVRVLEYYESHLALLITKYALFEYDTLSLLMLESALETLKEVDDGTIFPSSTAFTISLRSLSNSQSSWLIECQSAGGRPFNLGRITNEGLRPSITFLAHWSLNYVDDDRYCVAHLRNAVQYVSHIVKEWTR